MRTAWVTAISLVVLVAAIATLLGILIVEQPSQGADPAPDDGRSGVDDEGSERPPQVPADAEPAIIDHVIDGDTVRVIVAPHARASTDGSVRVRLLNIDTPELARDGQPGECGASEATARVEQLLAPGDLVWLAADVEDRDVYDRLLRAVWTEDGRFINTLLAVEGYAQALLVEPNDRFYNEVVDAVERAQRQGRGIWGELCPVP